MKKLSILLAVLIALSSVMPVYAAEDADSGIPAAGTVVADAADNTAVENDGAVTEDGIADTAGGENSTGGDSSVGDTANDGSVQNDDGTAADGSENPDGTQQPTEPGTENGEGADAPASPAKLENVYFSAPDGTTIDTIGDNNPDTYFSLPDMSDDYGTVEQYALILAADASYDGRPVRLDKVELTAPTAEALRDLRIQGSDDMYHWTDICGVHWDYENGTAVTLSRDADTESSFFNTEDENYYAFYRLVNPSRPLEVSEAVLYGEFAPETADYPTVSMEQIAVDGVTYRINHYTGEALVLGYAPEAIKCSTDLDPTDPNVYDVLKLRDFVTVLVSDGNVTYPVTAVLTNALSVTNQAGYYHWNGENYDQFMRDIEPYTYNTLILPDSIRYIETASIGGEYYYPDDQIHCIRIPYQPELEMQGGAVRRVTQMHDFDGPAYGDPNYRYTIYRDVLNIDGNVVNGGAILYDRFENCVDVYTGGHWADTFTMDIPGVVICGTAFQDAECLETLIIPEFKEIGCAAFANCNKLSRIQLGNAAGDSFIDANAFSGSRKLREITLPAGLARISQYAFEDWCGCLDEYTEHQQDQHEYMPGQLKVKFAELIPPQVVRDGSGAPADEGYNPFRNLTLIYPDSSSEAYLNSGLSLLKPYAMIPESEYENSKPKYEWLYDVDYSSKRVHIYGITLADDFDSSCDVITVPSEINGFPVHAIREKTFINVPADTKIYNNNVYRMEIHDWNDENRMIRVHGQNGFYQDYVDGKIGYIMADGYAAVYDYAPPAINENGELVIPDTVEYNGQTYTVVSILENALSTLNSIGFDDSGYSSEYEINYWDRFGHEMEAEINERYQAQLFSSLYIPDTVKQIAFHSIGGEGCEWNDCLESVRFPNNDRLWISDSAFMFCAALKSFDGLEHYDNRDNSGRRHFLYTNGTDAAVIYDKINNTTILYTTGAADRTFTLDIPHVGVDTECFAWAGNLESVTVLGFRVIFEKAFSEMNNLRTLYLTPAQNDNVLIFSYIVNGSTKLRDIYINGTVHEIAQRAFEDSCGCINPDKGEYTHHADWHRYAPGGLKVHFTQDTLPQIIDVWDNDYYPFESVTFVCPDALADVYCKADGSAHDALAQLNLCGVITESAYDALPSYTWHYEKHDDTKEIRITGITINGKFDPQNENIYIPSFLEGYPVTWMAGGVLNGLDGINIYDTNVFGIAYEDWRIVDRVDGLGGGHLCSVGGFDYYLLDDIDENGEEQNLAALMGYDPGVISDDGSRTLTVPETVEFNGKTYTVVGVLENGLSPFDATGFDHRGYNKELDIWLYDNPYAESLLEPGFYETLILPDSIRSMSRYCIGEDLWNDRLKTIRLPHNPDLIFDNHALHANSGLQTILGLTDYAQCNDSERYFVYSNNGAQMIYDRVTNAVFDYTSGSACTDFTVDIPNVRIDNDAFSCSTTLENVTITSFRETGNNVFASCNKLRTLTMTAAAEAAEVRIEAALTSDTSSLVRVDIRGDIDYLHQCAFEDWCTCIDDLGYHDSGRHRYHEGGLYVYFDDPTPPEIFGFDDNRPVLYNAVTAVCPDASVGAYENNENFRALNVYKVISETAFDQMEKYEWLRFQEHGETIITGIRFNHTFDIENDVVVIPSELDGCPVTWFSDGSLYNYLPQGVHVISANVYAMRFPWHEDAACIDFEAIPEGSFYGSNDTYSYYISEGMAAITGYTPDAVTVDEFGARTLAVPAEILHNGMSYPVVSIHPHALCAVYNAGYKSAEDFRPEDFDEALYRQYAYEFLVLPENLVQLAEDAVSGMPYRFESELETIAFPTTPRFVMYNTSVMRVETLRELYNLPEYGDEGLGNNFYFYRYNDGMGIYDRSRHSFHTYTVAAQTNEFVLDIDDIRVEDGAFYGAHNLEKVTVRRFRELGNMAFAACSNLREVNLDSMDNAILNDALFVHSPNVKVLYIPAGVTRVSKFAFEDFCMEYDCYHDANEPAHIEGNHTLGRGERHVYFYSENPPEITHCENDYPIYDSTTIHAPVQSVDAYAEAMQPIGYHGAILGHAPVTFHLGNAYGNTGETVFVDVYVTSDAPINSIALDDLLYEESVMSFVDFIPQVSSGVTVSNRPHLEYIGFMFDPTGTFDHELLCTIEFAIHTDAEQVDSAVTFATNVVKMNNEEIAGVVEAGSVRSLLQGDINMDGSVDIRDALCIIKRVAQQDDSYVRDYPASMDFDNNGIHCNNDDARYLFDYSMLPNKFPLFPAKAG